jgi:hypothetical protein
MIWEYITDFWWGNLLKNSHLINQGDGNVRWISGTQGRDEKRIQNFSWEVLEGDRFVFPSVDGRLILK